MVGQTFLSDHEEQAGMPVLPRSIWSAVRSFHLTAYVQSQLIPACCQVLPPDNKP